MFRTKLIVSITIFASFLMLTSAIKNKTRVIEKKILKINKEILFQKKDINEAQLDFHYLTSPSMIEKKLNMIGFDNYQPIKYSNIFFDISEFTKIKDKISNLEAVNEKK